MEPKGHILLVENHPDTRAMMIFALSRDGFKVTAASSLEEAYALAEKGGFDLYLLNHVFPDGSGITLCQEIRKLHRETPIIIFSTAAHQSEQQAGLEAGANAYMVKPREIYYVQETVERLINEARKT